MKGTNSYLPILSISAAALALGAMGAFIFGSLSICMIPGMAIIAMVVGALAIKEQSLNEVEKNTSMCGIGIGALTLLLCAILILLLLAFIIFLFSIGS